MLYPFWLAEGMATNFEPPDPAKNFGPHAENPSRHSLLTQSYQAGRLMPTADFILMTQLPLKDLARTAELYSQAWGFFQFLYKKHPDQLREFLVKLSRLPRGPRPVDALKREFEEAFGPVDAIDRQWQIYLKFLH